MLIWSVVLNKTDTETKEGYKNTRNIWTVNMDKMEKISWIEHITNEEIVERVEDSWTLMDKIQNGNLNGSVTQCQKCQKDNWIEMVMGRTQAMLHS